MAFLRAPFLAFFYALLRSLQSFLMYIKLVRRPATSDTDIESAPPSVPPSTDPPAEETARASPTPHLDVHVLLSRATTATVVLDADNSYLTQASVYSQDGSFNSMSTVDGGSPELSSDILDARPKDQLLFAGSGCVRKVTLSIRNPDAGAEDGEENSTTGSISGPASRNSIFKGDERRQGMVLPAGSGFSNIAGRRGKTPLSIRVLPTMVPVSWAKPPPELACDQTPETSNCSTPLPKYSTRENTPVVDADKSDAWLSTDHRTVQHNKQGYVLSYLAQQNGIASLRLPLLEGQAPASLTNPPPYGSTASLNGSPELSSAQASEAGNSTEGGKPPRGIRPLRLPAQVAKRNITPQKASPVLRPLLLPQDMAHRTEHMSRPSSVLTAVPESLEPQDVPRSTSKDAPVSPRMERILDLLDAAGVASCDSAPTSHPFDFSRIGREDSSSSIASTNGSMNSESTSYPEDLEAQQGIESWKNDIISAYTVSIPEMLVD